MKPICSEEVREALETGKPVVALESTVIAHGLPYPDNLETARRMESTVRDAGAVPATIGIIAGNPKAGLADHELELFATEKIIRKVSTRDIPIATALGQNGATTVSGTMFLAHLAGIRVFATGGIGGVHRGSAHDVSADLPALAGIPMVTVCSGAKIVLDIAATREWLETSGVPVLGWQTEDYPAFYLRESGLNVDQRVENEIEVAAIATARDALGLDSAVLLTVPVAREYEADRESILKILEDSLNEANTRGILGKDVTPFLLKRMAESTGGATINTNKNLLIGNAAVAAKVAVAMSESNR
ncbi:MAG: pseudouridine-5'-phosphate glycosidase [Pyrinomonadaceae bacterium]